MKRLWPALTLVLLMLGTLAPCDALCTSGHQPSAHACCRHTGHTPEVKTCCALRPVQQSAIPQISQIASAATHLPSNALATFVARLSPLAPAYPPAFPPQAIPIPPLVLRI